MPRLTKDQAAEAPIEDVIAKLTPRQYRFCEEYIKDFNASQAAVRAEYDVSDNKNKVGSQLVKNPFVRRVIDHLITLRAADTVVNVDYVVNKIVKAIEKADNQNNHAAVLRGAELLARYLGMFTEKHEISGPDGEAIKLEQRIKEDVADFTSSIARLAKRNNND
jgi:phage terminase small subunit